MKTCTICSNTLSLDNFYVTTNNGRIYIPPRCKECVRKDSRKRMAARCKLPDSRAKATKTHRNYRIRLRSQVFALYGNKCLQCNNCDLRVLQIDHKHGGGAIERKRLVDHQVYRNVLNNPDNYQLLCANCNWRKREDHKLRSAEVTALRMEAITTHGGCCMWCKDMDQEILQFDHVNNDGRSVRTHRNMKRRYKEYIAKLQEVQLLCANCHQLKTVGVDYASLR